jgi:rod shape-determining protein MreC
MQNLFAFLRRFRVFIFFSALQFLCLVLYVQFVSFPKSVYLSTASTLNGKIQSVEGKLTSHFDLEENNTALRLENAQLRKRVFTNFYRVERTKTQVNDTAYEQSFSFITTKIINASVVRRNNYFTIDVGEQQGIKKNMGVISPKGVVGIVYKVGEHFSLVKSILTQDINLDIMIGIDGPRGILKWDGFHPKKGIVTGVSTDLTIKKNTNIYTLGASGIFPKGIKLGNVISKSRVEDQALWNLEVRFSEDYRTLHSAYVITSLIQKELQDLQLDIPEDHE